MVKCSYGFQRVEGEAEVEEDEEEARDESSGVVQEAVQQHYQYCYVRGRS